MAIENPVHMNEYGLPLNAITWLETHHRSKLAEREQMIRDLHLKRGSCVVDAGCGPGLWTPLLAQALGPQGRILGVDISLEALITARQRSQNTWYQEQVVYQQSTIEHLPVSPGSIQNIFTANVSQYLAQPVETFRALGHYLTPGGQLTVKDIDFGTLRFYTVDPTLQARIFQARESWERQRVLKGFMYEDSWVGSKLAGYLRAAGYEHVRERGYKVTRRAPLTPDVRTYLQGITEWFICEDAPFLGQDDIQRWLRCFEAGTSCVFDQEAFSYEETEFVVTGIWPGESLPGYR